MGQIKVKDLMERVAKAGGPNFRKLKGWRDGYVVGISACVGSDCSRIQELAKELSTFGYEFIGPTISRWEGSEEQGFLVHAEVEGQVRHLISLGTVKYNQSDVYGWKLPLADTDIIIKTDSNGTELDGTMYEIVAPIALSVKDLELTKGITESTAPTYNAIRFISEEEKRALESEGQVSHKGSFYSWNNRKVLYAFMVNNYYKVENYLPLVKAIERLLDSRYKYIVYLNLPNDGWTNRPYLTPYDLSLFDNLTEQEEKLLGVFDIDDSTYDTGPVYLAPEFRITTYTKDQVVQIKRIEEVLRIVKESKMEKQKMYRDDIYDITANMIVQSMNIKDILKAIKNREKSAEDEQGSEGLWDLAFEETISQLEMDLWGADEEAYSYYMDTAEEVYDILVDNIDNYKAGRQPVLVESNGYGNRTQNVGSEYFGEQATFLYVTNPNNPDDYILYEILITDVKGEDVFTIYFGDSGSRNLNQKTIEEWIADELNDQRITGVHDGIKVLWTQLVYTTYQSFLSICYESADGEVHVDALFKVDEDLTDSFDPEDVKAMFKK